MRKKDGKRRFVVAVLLPGQAVAVNLTGEGV
jgi:hypothetical protein